MKGPLEGVCVLDFSSLVPGPIATLMLAEAGADVIKIERPDRGDEMRSYSPKFGQDSVNFGLLNRGKKSIAVDLKDSADRQRMLPLLEKADVIVEGFRPGVMDRLNLGYAEISEMNPGIIYCSLSGYGKGCGRERVAGHDLNYIGNAGLLSLSMGSPEQPTVPPALIADIAGGAYPALINILLAIVERHKTGKGQYLDIAMAENVFPFMYWAMGNLQAANQAPTNGNDYITGGSPRYNLYPTADGRMVAAAPLEQKFWDVFVAAIGLEEAFVDDEKEPVRTRARVAEIIQSRTAEYWREKFDEADCCCSIVKTVDEALADPFFAERGVFSCSLANASGETISALPLPIVSGLRASSEGVKSAPLLGEHNNLLE